MTGWPTRNPLFQGFLGIYHLQLQRFSRIFYVIYLPQLNQSGIQIQEWPNYTLQCQTMTDTYQLAQCVTTFNSPVIFKLHPPDCKSFFGNVYCYYYIILSANNPVVFKRFNVQSTNHCGLDASQQQLQLADDLFLSYSLGQLL